jgi:hypothetical protein
VDSTEFSVLFRSKSRVLERLNARLRLDIEIYPMITTAIRGQNLTLEKQQSEADQHREEAASWDRTAAGKFELLETRLEESLQLLQELRRNDAGRGRRPTRKRR